MRTLRAVVGGLRTAVRSPRLLLILWTTNVVLTLPAAGVMTHALHDSFGRSRVNQAMLEGLDTAWLGEWEAEAQGLAETFTANIGGIGAVLENLEAWWSGRMFLGNKWLVGLGVLSALAWIVLLGGLLDHLLRPRDDASLDGFLWAGGRYFLRFFRLLLLSGVAYFGVYKLSRLVFGWIDEATREATSETLVFTWVAVAAGLTVALLVAVRTVFDYAKITTVAEERRSAVFATWSGLRFVLRNPLASGGVVLVFGALGGTLIGIYAAVAPGVGPSTGIGILLAFALGQIYLVARLTLRFALLGAEVRLYGERSGG